ncbi:hypothetical protein [Haloterrigena alkaliphila]|uniref:Uncharacterized protein n=1 Tax=Haloterrigena alkaliphila TaxID=2816475 RepID=A0A8A2VFS8_9EURY|nr:hypothetical protein [Haloterrigena alkaliphila]QSW99205.1 hypothetical protein J0X25_17790 [Haloterrigena alkaliphila]
MPVKGERSVAICRQCQSALAVRILSDGSIRPIGTGTTCSCGGESFTVLGDSESDAGGSEIADRGPDSDDKRRHPPA